MKARTREETIREHYSEIGKKGARARLRKSTKAQRRAWGKKGGRPRKTEKP